ncbi:MAG: 2-dehydropantoate 2-reductase N-terminal domain-containing protein [Terracidiphilus sp.]|nr:2-dehydropantoate 2-reductase N-terminal domain-containing protein [Terracidiphilus sp.]MDR3799300.1 2-dehydropantoate 2-reductase N-terminal domain-containing protein [Terracidiphilus sp.]
MSSQSPRILVLGAGVNGSVCAAELHRAGCNVAVLARPHRYQELTERGIEIENPLNGTRTSTKVPVIDRLDPEDIYDYILVVIRNNQMRELLPVLARNHSPCVVLMVNTALGPEAWAAELGADRVMLGFVFAGGRREGSLVRAMRVKGASTRFGELNGATTPRLTRFIGILNRSGLKAKVEPRMADWLANHASMVAPFAMLILKHGCDTRALGRSQNDLRLLADSFPEILAVLRANGRRIVPRALAVFGALPRFMLVALFRMFLSTRIAEIGGAWHCSQAPDEMNQLASELKELVARSGLPVPALRKILAEV